MNNQAADWIAVDWGGSFVRAWLMSAEGQILAAQSSQQGALKLRPEQFEAALLALLHAWLPPVGQVTVLICGMAGSRQGWQEAPYLAIPLTLSHELNPTALTTQDARLRVFILPGLKQLNPPDVMRGEETQLLGFITQNPKFNGVVALPGTHNKWVRLHNQCVLNFTTCMTGELFDLLAHQSVLRHSVQSEAWDHTAFDQAVLQALEQPAATSQRLFALRAHHLLEATTPDILRAQLSGELLGLELSAIHAAAYLQTELPLVLIGSSKLSALYARALKLMGITAHVETGECLTVAGLNAAYQERLA